MSDAAPAVRRATPDDRDAVIATVLAAFHDDPAWHHMTAGDFATAAPLFASTLFDSRVDLGSIWVTDDCLGTAMWEKKDGTGNPHGAGLWTQFDARVSPVIRERIHAYDAALAAVGPQPAYWYLGVLATHPSAQGRGCAQAVMAPAFAIADADGLDCWLETSKPGNTEFYARRGFSERIAVDIPGGPDTWWMRRPAPEAR